jgi:hypothetical protein
MKTEPFVLEKFIDNDYLCLTLGERPKDPKFNHAVAGP